MSRGLTVLTRASGLSRHTATDCGRVSSHRQPRKRLHVLGFVALRKIVIGCVQLTPANVPSRGVCPPSDGGYRPGCYTIWVTHGAVRPEPRADMPPHLPKSWLRPFA
jgi:hypothetical protein